MSWGKPNKPLQILAKYYQYHPAAQLRHLLLHPPLHPVPPPPLVELEHVEANTEEKVPREEKQKQKGRERGEGLRQIKSVCF
jgi:hypothetical protein